MIVKNEMNNSETITIGRNGPTMYMCFRDIATELTEARNLEDALLKIYAIILHS
jgi:hypothetical protein